MSTEETTLRGSRTIVIVAGLLWLVHIGVVAALGTKFPGAVFSDLLQLALGVVMIYAAVDASRRSEGLARSFWRLTATAYSFWLIAQTLSVYNDLAASPFVSWINNLLFCFWFVPLAMAMFLDPEQQAGRLDALVALDFVQAVLVCVAAYLYFFYLPKADATNELAHSVWTPYFAGYAFGGSFRRALRRRGRGTRGRYSAAWESLGVSGCVDALYFYGPGRGLTTGAWFDLCGARCWSLPSSSQLPGSKWNRWKCRWTRRSAKRIYTEIFFLLYPLLMLFMSLRLPANVWVGRRGRALFICVFQRAAARHRTGCSSQSAAAGKPPRRPGQSVEPQSNSCDSRAGLAASRATRTCRPDHDRRRSFQNYQRQSRTPAGGTHYA
jgi:hypothetical protein